MTELAEPLLREIEELPARFAVRHRTVIDQVILTALVRSVPVVIHLDTAAYPFAPPRPELSAGWSWDRRGYGRGRKIRGLECQERWNRTLGIVALLRELEHRFREEPPTRKRIRSFDWRRWLPLLAALIDRIRALWRRLAGRLTTRRRPAEAAADAASPEGIRAAYDEVIREKSAQVRRYREAVSELVALGQEKAARLAELRDEVRRLEESESAAMAEARREVERLEAAGKTPAEIRASEGYRRRQAAFAERSADLEELQERAAELAADAAEHHAKVEKHEAQLEALVREVEDLKAEAAEMVTDMTLTQLEQEIVDVKAGISRAGTGEELENLRRQLRQARAAVRVTREASDLVAVADADEEYLEAARRDSAARRFDDALGLEETAEKAAGPREEPPIPE